MTLSETYAAWLRDAMRAAGLDIDRQRGGGRQALAQAVGVSASTVGRWLTGDAVPSPEHFEPIADAVGVPVVTMLVDSGIISAASLTLGQPTDVRFHPITPAQAADELGLTDPTERALFMRELAQQNRRHLHAATEGDGDAVAQ
ncbi:helix-turn-helix transcriptional regulator [Kitasatospora sp. NPDC048545]|uniref:helix-turn-helix domain-containing protein n=1 Tax=Kitasatospora sp. NPDC048545 TaxID=3157208 RepID=UPI0033C370F7